MEPNNSVLVGVKLEFDIADDPHGNSVYTDDATRSRGPDHSGSNYAAVSEQPSGAGFGMFGLKAELKTETPDPDMTEADDPLTALNIQVKKEPVSDSGDETSDDVTEGCAVTFSNSDLNFDNDESNTNSRKEKNKAFIEKQVSKATKFGTKKSATRSKETKCHNRDVIKPKNLLSMEKKFSCQLCSSSFVKFSSLKYHMSSYHGQKYHVALAQHTGETFMGDRCLATKPSLEELTAKTQTRIVSSCRKKRQQHFDEEGTSKELSDHQEILNKCLKCKFCGKDFTWLHNLKTHQRIHTGERPYQCKDCDKTFNTSQTLKTHQRIHTGEKPYQCTDCSKAFTQLISLKSHRRIHTGDKPYQCTDCPKTFNFVTNLKTHQRIHTGAKPYQCTDCDKAFSQSCNLKRHRRIHTDLTY